MRVWLSALFCLGFGVSGCLTDRDPVPAVETCSNGVADPGESGLDCGGPCQPCATTGCEDCRGDEVCAGGLCVESTCNDGVQGGDEAGVDCGGSCAPCVTVADCNGDDDCGDNEQCAEGRCVLVSTCDDGVQGGDETDVDCGGADCGVCRVGASCGQSSDCASDLCVEGRCQPVAAPSCDDGLTNGNETDRDCGGSCEPCMTGLRCVDDADCISERCGAGVCTQSCDDGVTGGQETDVDCGGPFCGPCELGATCERDQDCQTGSCDDGACGQFEGNSCSTGIECYNECAQFSPQPDECVQGCLDEMTPNAQFLFTSIFDCIFETCPDGDGICVEEAVQDACGPTIQACYFDI